MENSTPPSISEESTQAIKDFVSRPYSSANGYKVSEVQTYEAQVQPVEDDLKPNYRPRQAPTPTPVTKTPPTPTPTPTPKQEGSRVQIPRSAPTPTPIPVPTTKTVQPTEDVEEKDVQPRPKLSVSWIFSLLKKDKDKEPEALQTSQTPKKPSKPKKDDNSTAELPIHADVPLYFLGLCAAAKLLTFVPGSAVLLAFHTWVYIAVAIGFASFYKPKWRGWRHLWFLVIAYGLYFILR